MSTKHGFLAAVFKDWCFMEGSEWGDSMINLWQAYDLQYIWSDEELDAMLGIMLPHLLDCEDDLREHYGEEDEYLDAQISYLTCVSYWTQRAQELKEQGELIEALKLIPEWMKPPEGMDKKTKIRADLDRRRSQAMDQVTSLNRQIADLDGDVSKR